MAKILFSNSQVIRPPAVAVRGAATWGLSAPSPPDSSPFPRTTSPRCPWSSSHSSRPPSPSHPPPHLTTSGWNLQSLGQDVMLPILTLTYLYILTSFPTTLQLRPADTKLDFWRSPPMAGIFPSPSPGPGSISASPSSSCQVG